MSRIPVLLGIVLLIVAVSFLNVTILPTRWIGNNFPYIILGVVLFLVMRNGGCCGRSCKSDADEVGNPNAAAM